MIALLFALFSVAMIVSYFGFRRTAYAIFAASLVMSLYWLKFHATSALTIQL